jgi:hypothetical protein
LAGPPAGGVDPNVWLAYGTCTKFGSFGEPTRRFSVACCLPSLCLIARAKCWHSEKAEPFGAHSHMAAHTAPPPLPRAARGGTSAATQGATGQRGRRLQRGRPRGGSSSGLDLRRTTNLQAETFGTGVRLCQSCVAAEVALIGSKNGSNARNFAISSIAMQRFGSSVAH